MENPSGNHILLLWPSKILQAQQLAALQAFWQQRKNFNT